MNFPQTTISVAAQKNGGHAETPRQMETNMLQITEKAPKDNGPDLLHNLPSGDIRTFVQEGFVTLRADQANQILLHAEYDRQRKIDQLHVDVLADIMKRGQWAPKDKIDFARMGNTLIMVNGYHRMRGQVQCGKTIEWTIVIHPCKTVEQVRALYYKFDTNTRTRQASQILAGIDFADKNELAKQTATALYNAIPVIASGFSKSRTDRDHLTNRVVDRRVAYAEKYVPAAKVYEGCLAGLQPRIKSKFLSAGVMAVALVTLQEQPGTALEFWSGAAQNDGLRIGDPRRTLHLDMVSRQLNAGSALQAIYVPTHAWNAWFENRTLKIIKVPSYRTKVTITGTRFEEE